MVITVGTGEEKGWLNAILCGLSAPHFTVEINRPVEIINQIKWIIPFRTAGRKRIKSQINLS